MPLLSRRVLISALAASAAMAPLAALGQVPAAGVPQELIPNQRPQQGDNIRICLDTLSVARDFDHAVAEAIAGVLLLKPEFSDAPSGFPMDGFGYLEELQITMATTCDLLPGMALNPGAPFPDWASISRSYAQIPFVLVVADPAFNTLEDIPRDRRIGTALGSVGETVFLSYNEALPADRKWRRLSYADHAKMLERLRDNTLAGMILWQPVLHQLTGGELEKAGLRIIPTVPLQPMDVGVGVLVSGRDAYLRTAVDDAIGALVADGTIQALLDRFGYAGIPGP